MILVLKSGAKAADVDALKQGMQRRGLMTQDIRGEHTHMLGLAGDVSSLDEKTLERLEMIERIIRVSEPYKLAGRRFHPVDTVVAVGAAPV